MSTLTQTGIDSALRSGLVRGYVKVREFEGRSPSNYLFFGPVVGDRLGAPNWAAINVAKGRCLSAPPEKIATLSNLHLDGARLEPGFTPHHDTYTALVGSAASAFALTPTATSGRHQSLAIDGVAHRSGTAYSVQLGDGTPQLTIVVTSPDGSVSRTYTLIVSRAAR